MRLKVRKNRFEAVIGHQSGVSLGSMHQARFALEAIRVYREQGRMIPLALGNGEGVKKMDIIDHRLTFKLTVGEVETWMAALRRAALGSTVPCLPWQACPFFIQHGELVRLTGYGAGDHEDLKGKLADKWEKF